MKPSPLDYPLNWRSLIFALTPLTGDYTAIHNSLVIEEFCQAFDIPISAVSGRLETYVHACPGGRQ
jgi:hypothetical protein